MRASILILPLVLMGCAEGGLFAGVGQAPEPAAPEPVPVERPEATPVVAPSGNTVVAPPRAVTSTVGALDTLSEAEKAEARNEAENSAGRALGEVTVSLGNPADTGLWVKTALVSEEVPGTVTTASGESVAVALRPLDGSGGAQISLSALQALGLSLAGLHTVTLARS